MDEKEYKKLYWKEAANGGLILGLAMFGLSFVSYFFKLSSDYSGMMSVIQVAIISVLIIITGRKVANLKGNSATFSYGQAISFVLAMMIFTGFIYGVGEYFLQVIIDPVYFDQLYIDTLKNSNFSKELIDKLISAREDYGEIVKNPILMAVSGIATMGFYGGIIGVIASVFIKKPTNNF